MEERVSKKPFEGGNSQLKIHQEATTREMGNGKWEMRSEKREKELPSPDSHIPPPVQTEDTKFFIF